MPESPSVENRQLKNKVGIPTFVIFTQEIYGQIYYKRFAILTS
jgi:hypothetical protein